MSEIEKAIECLQVLRNGHINDKHKGARVSVLITTAIKALQEKLERDKGCAWCQGKTSENFECNWVDDEGHTITTDDNEVIWTDAEFCPACGKKLGEERQ